MKDFENRVRDVLQSGAQNIESLAETIARDRGRSIADILSIDNITGVFDRRRVRGSSTGYPTLDATIGGLRSRTCTVLAAATGIGKSLFSLNILIHLAKSGERVCYFDLENGFYESVERILRIWYALPKDVFEEKAEQGRLLEMKAQLDCLDYFSVDDLLEMGLDKLGYRLIDALIRDRAKRGTKVFLVDPLQALESDFRNSQSILGQQGEIVKVFKDTAQSTNTSIIICHHLRKSQSGGGGWVRYITDIEDVKYRLPTIDDLRGSGKIADFATDVWGMVRLASDKEQYKRREMFLRVLKNRSGLTGDVRFHFDENTLIFNEHPDNKKDVEAYLKESDIPSPSKDVDGYNKLANEFMSSELGDD